MTNKEYLASLLGFAPSNPNSIEAALIDAGINGADTYVAGNSVTLKIAAIQVLKILLSTADITKGTGETAFLHKYDRDAILKRIAQLEDEVGITVGRPAITGRSPW